MLEPSQHHEAASAAADAHHSPTLAEADTTSAAGVGVALACLAIALAIISYFLYAYFIREAEEVRHTQVLSKGSEALRALHASEQEQLGNAGIIDAENGIYRVPLDKGVELFVREARQRQAAGVAQRIVQPAPVEDAAPEAEAQ